MEHWKVIPNHPNYMISDRGQVYSIRRAKIMKGSRRGVERRGRVKLSNHQERFEPNVARLMLMTFRPVKDSSSLIVAHNDGNVLNDTLSNLRWTTDKGNAADRRLHGTERYAERNTATKLTVMAVRVIRKLLKHGRISQEQIGKYFGVKQTAISSIKFNRTWVGV